MTEAEKQILAKRVSRTRKSNRDLDADIVRALGGEVRRVSKLGLSGRTPGSWRAFWEHSHHLKGSTIPYYTKDVASRQKAIFKLTGERMPLDQLAQDFRPQSKNDLDVWKAGKPIYELPVDWSKKMEEMETTLDVWKAENVLPPIKPFYDQKCLADYRSLKTGFDELFDHEHLYMQRFVPPEQRFHLVDGKIIDRKTGEEACLSLINHLNNRLADKLRVPPMET